MDLPGETVRYWDASLVSYHQFSDVAEVHVQAVAGCCEKVPGAGAGADELAGVQTLPARAQPVGHPGQRRQRIAHRGAAVARFYELAVQVEINFRIRQVESPPIRTGAP